MKHVTVRKKLTITQMTAAALMTAVTCILGPMSLPIPLSPVPISLTNLVIYLMAYVLGARLSFISYGTYLLLGAAGLPVFSGFSGGLAKLVGPTGGYLTGFLLLAPIAGFFTEKFPERTAMHVLGMVLGTAVCYLFGTVWLALQLNMDFVSGLFAGVIPYLPGDMMKIVAAVLIGPRLHRAVSQISGR